MKARAFLKRIKSDLNLMRFAVHDALRYYQHASGFGGRWASQDNLLSSIAVGAHVLERGLALPAARPWFGRTEIAQMGASVRAYFEAGGSPHAPELRAARGALKAYSDWHRGAKGCWTGHVVHALITELAGHGVELSGDQPAGVAEVGRDDVVAHSRGPFEEFASSRRSVRIYGEGPVSREAALAAVRLGQSAPSVCNRQSGRVHLFLTKEKVAQVLSCHIGSGGFREHVPAVAVVTSDLRTFYGVRERYQSWIDGGLLLMQFLNGLHAQGLGGCPLNWSVMPDRDMELRRIAGIPEHERIIALVSFGNLPEVVRFAKSPRRPLESMCVIHDGDASLPPNDGMPQRQTDPRPARMRFFRDPAGPRSARRS
jgi:nitroreductase